MILTLLTNKFAKVILYAILIQCRLFSDESCSLRHASVATTALPQTTICVDYSFVENEGRKVSYMNS